MIGLTCGKLRGSKVEKGMKWQVSWDIRNADWIKYCREMDETMPGDLVTGDGKTIDDWEKGTKETIQETGRKIIGRKRFKIGGKKLKGWWDEEVKVALSRKKDRIGNKRS